MFIIVAFILAVLVNATISTTCDAIRQMGGNTACLLSNHTLDLCPDRVHLTGIGSKGAITGNRLGFDGEVSCRFRELAGEVFLNRLLSLLAAIIVIIAASGLARTTPGTAFAGVLGGLLRLLLGLLLFIAQSVEAALHHGPKIHKDPIGSLTAGSGIVIIDRLIDPGDILIQLVDELAGVTG